MSSLAPPRGLSAERTGTSPLNPGCNAPRADNFLMIVAATANAQSLCPAELRACHARGLAHSAKMEHLDNALHELGVKIVGVQESCIKGSVARKMVNFIAFTSSANAAGQLGVESWIHVDLLQRAQVSTEAASPRLLFNTVRGKHILLKHVVAHAPCESDGDDIKEAFGLLRAARQLYTTRLLPGMVYRCQ